MACTTSVYTVPSHWKVVVDWWLVGGRSCSAPGSTRATTLQWQPCVPVQGCKCLLVLHASQNTVPGADGWQSHACKGFK